MAKNNNIQFRSATVNDIKALLDIEKRCFIKYYKAHRFTERQFAYYIKNPSAITIVAIEKGHLIGYIIGITQSGRLKKTARLYSIAILPSFRKKGIGRNLLKILFEFVRNHGATRVTLEVAEMNTRARYIFSLSGFREKETMIDYYGNGANGIRMEYKL